jgi:hypothetical protein
VSAVNEVMAGAMMSDGRDLFLYAAMVRKWLRDAGETIPAPTKPWRLRFLANSSKPERFFDYVKLEEFWNPPEQSLGWLFYQSSQNPNLLRQVCRSSNLVGQICIGSWLNHHGREASNH